MLYPGEINDAQHLAWCKTIEVVEGPVGRASQMAIFPEDRLAPPMQSEVAQVRLTDVRLERPRRGACWLALELWEQLDLDAFWAPRLQPSREGTQWLTVLKTLVAYRLIDPGSEWRLHRQWFDRSATGDLLDEDGVRRGRSGATILNSAISEKPRKRWAQEGLARENY